MRSPADADDAGAGVFADISTDPVGPLTALLRLGRRVTFPTRAEIDKHDALRELVGPDIDRMNMFPLLDSTVLGTLLWLVSAPFDPNRALLHAWLTGHGVVHAWTLAPPLAAAEGWSTSSVVPATSSRPGVT